MQRTSIGSAARGVRREARQHKIIQINKVVHFIHLSIDFKGFLRHALRSSRFGLKQVCSQFGKTGAFPLGQSDMPGDRLAFELFDDIGQAIAG